MSIPSDSTIDKMSKGELLDLCEKYSVDGGKTLAQMRMQLKKHFSGGARPKEEDEDDLPPPKKVKSEPSKEVKELSGVCSKGEDCPELHLIQHRNAFKHTGFRDNPVKCRDGLGCSLLRDKAHLQKYAHDDGNVCKEGANCPKLHLLQHRNEMEHPGFRINPYPCRYGMKCEQINDKVHLQKYAHSDDPAVNQAVNPKLMESGSGSAKSVASPIVPPPPPPPPPTPAPPPTSEPLPTNSGGGSGSRDKIIAEMIRSKSLADFPLEAATPPTLVPIDKDSEEFWEVEEKFCANLQGRNEDYVAKRIKAGKKPLRFILVGLEKIIHPTLECRYELKKRELMKIRDSKELRDRISFHGTHPKNISSILKYGLLRFQHPLNPCKTQVDDGYFGTNKKGIYVSRYADYTLKYSNRVVALDVGDEVKTIMFKTLPGKSKHIEKLVGAIDPTPDHDSHSSPTHLEWYLFDEAQCCPTYVCKVKAVEDTRTAADDE
eukprot:PhF_6_TR6175/c0_g1_i1/m.9237